MGGGSRGTIADTLGASNARSLECRCSPRSWIGFPRLGRGLSHCNPALRCYPPKRRRKPDSGWYSDQSVDGDQALRMMTMGPAYAAFWERDLGALTVGRYADFTVLSADPYQVPTTSLR